MKTYKQKHLREKENIPIQSNNVGVHCTILTVVKSHDQEVTCVVLERIRACFDCRNKTTRGRK